MKPLELTPAQQAAAVERAGKNTALLSGAGCGKTLVLARRFTELLMSHAATADPQGRAEAMSRFVALTFTDKAALEMAQRVRALLRDLAARAGSDEDRRGLLGWLEAASEARISTIHGFCAAVLRACAVEAGLDPAFTVCAETVVTDRMIAEAAEETILSALEEGDVGTADLLTETTFDSLVKIVRDLVERRTQCDLHAFIDPARTLKCWREQLQQARQAAQQRLREDKSLAQWTETLNTFSCSDTADKLYPFVAEAKASLQQILNQPLEQCGEAFANMERCGKPGNAGKQSAWPVSPKDIHAKLKALAAAVKEYAPPAENFTEIDEQSARAAAALARLAVAADERYRRAKRAGSLLDFDDLILHTRDLLKNNGAPRKRLASGVEQLLIDEAQDTDATQLDLLLSLLRSDPDTPPPEGKLFLVGDAKQSIYRFRGAQVEVFENLCETLGSSRRVDLDVSFRTNEAGTSFVNDVFGPMMGRAYAPIHSHGKAGPGHPSVEILLAEASAEDGRAGEFEDAESAVAAQAALTAQRIAEMLAGGEKIVRDAETKAYRPVRAGDIAILFSRMPPSLLFERELQKRNLPYYVVAGAGFFHQQEIHDALNALQAVANPFDDPAVLGALRSAMFGLSDDTLMHLARTHTPPYLPGLAPRRLAEKIGQEQLESLHFACDLLRRLSARKDAMGVDELLQRLIEETGYEAALLSRPQGRRAAGNVRRLLEYARAAAGRMDLAEFIAEMNEQSLSESRFEQASVAGEDEDVIRLMTIHKAKGLEFPVVFVPDLNRGRREKTRKVLLRRDWGLTTGLVFGRGDANEWDEEEQNGDKSPAPLAHRLAAAAEKDDQARETLRSYYVALTRHEDHLVLVGADMRGKDGRIRETGSFLAQLDDVLDISGRLGAGETILPYGGGKYQAILRRETPGPPVVSPAVSTTKPSRLDSGNDSTPPLLGPLPESLGEVELAVTALSDFEQCPALFHWRYELRGPEGDFGFRKQQEIHPIPGLQSEIAVEPTPNLKFEIQNLKSEISPALLGTLLHRCMELYHFARPQPAGELIARVLAERDDLPPTNAEELTALLEGMLATFRDQPLAEQLASATQMHRELDFLLRAGRASLRGQIDLLFRDAAGAWRIVDWKSDRAETQADLDHKLQRYELQLLVYALAVSRFTGEPPADASLYFLRNGRVRSVQMSAETLAAAEKRIETLTSQLIAARRENHFIACGKETCPHCRVSNFG
ncbi:MAG: UvrD-helicase domain-containing protein [Phycisphaerae bacterium]|nr:UvrD-helicase domain-containing protein [Phycisphaerae bacterium]